MFSDVDDENTVPDFQAKTQLGNFSMHDYTTGNWVMLFTHPANFTPVCTTEFGMVAKLRDEFEARNTKILGLSINSVEAHEAWISDINETQETEVSFPIVADEDAEIAKLLGVCNRNGKIVNRTLFLVDPNRKVRLSMVYPENTGRNFYEILRIIDSLQLSENFAIGTPANWRNGEDVVILPHVSDERAKQMFRKGFTTIKPYLRITPQPELEEAIPSPIVS